MFALRFASLFLLSTTFATADIETILNTLQSSTNIIVPQITSLAQSEVTTTPTALTSLLSQLTAELNTASSSLSSLVTGSLKRQSDDGVATLTADIVTDITNALNEITGTTLEQLPATAFAGVDTSLNDVLGSLNKLLPGVLADITPLLIDDTGLLGSLNFPLILATLGLPILGLCGEIVGCRVWDNLENFQPRFSTSRNDWYDAAQNGVDVDLIALYLERLADPPNVNRLWDQILCPTFAPHRSLPGSRSLAPTVRLLGVSRLRGIGGRVGNPPSKMNRLGGLGLDSPCPKWLKFT
ncbi:hypothetical protein C8R44DRAFT_752696 [Mycena epipterygia]|nr:hypothetical protein C8R44DRAFT_752696 [Mycena epipterygia]